MSKVFSQLSLRRSFLKASWQANTANLSRQFGMVASSTLFTMASLVLIKGVLNSLNTKFIGGYNYSELVFMLLLFEAGYHFADAIFLGSTAALPNLINGGDLDLYLIKPVKLKTQLRYTYMSIQSTMGTTLLLGFIILSQINFSEMNIKLINLPIAIFVILSGVFCYATIFFVFTSSAFWFGESKRIMMIGYSLSKSSNPPMSISPRWFLILNLTLLPISFSSMLAAQITLKQFGFSEKIYFLAAASVLALSFIFQKYWWRVCLKKYSSASS